MRNAALAVGLALLVTACDPSGSNGSELGPVSSGDLPVVDLLGEVSSVGDGDSFRVVVDGEEIEIRLIGINAPERDECFGLESAAWLTDQLEGKEVGLALEPEPDQFGRLLAVAVVDQTKVNLAALASGHALVVSAEGIDRALFVQEEQRARLDRTGLWADDICGARGSRANLEIVEVDYNPPGPDANETVTIVNNGAQDIDMDGFVLRDESSVNRFEMPAVVLGQGELLTVEVSDCRTGESATSWCSEQPVFNNDGDTALLLDPFGRVVALARY
ncbi:MAG TPA: lamin tail domain-containing protein [Acidimicrobiia bacterium]|nr:lamin tail domain-containing protein [Acidimicrobiia bacterium]